MLRSPLLLISTLWMLLYVPHVIVYVILLHMKDSWFDVLHIFTFALQALKLCGFLKDISHRQILTFNTPKKCYPLKKFLGCMCVCFRTVRNNVTKSMKFSFQEYSLMFIFVSVW